MIQRRRLSYAFPKSRLLLVRSRVDGPSQCPTLELKGGTFLRL